MTHGADDVLSAGIDIGTTTTHMVLSRLQVANSSVLNQAPRLMISKREVVFNSVIRDTPLTADGIIDAKAVSALVGAEYARAGVTAAQVDTGAIIITGESARLRNAEMVVSQLSTLAGDFVVASAGPRLESVLAGRGSGAAQASLARGKTICNVDIGGGTTNLAVFSSGRPLDTACLAVGGRCVRLDATGKVSGSSPAGQRIIESLPETARADGHLIARRAAQLIAELMTGSTGSPALDALRGTLTVSRFTSAVPQPIDEFWISGGVGKLMQQPEANPFQFLDIGPLLAQALEETLRARGIEYFIPGDAILATVIGAGMHSMQLSGSTISASMDCLPLRNLPLVRLTAPGQSLREALAAQDQRWQDAPAAVLLEGLVESDYDTLTLWADALAAQFRNLGGVEPLIVVVFPDVGMALGQLLKIRLSATKIVVIDGIQQMTGDFIDIGQPLRGNALPVVVKELIFG